MRATGEEEAKPTMLLRACGTHKHRRALLVLTLPLRRGKGWLLAKLGERRGVALG
jgi:hypothetical protein